MDLLILLKKQWKIATAAKTCNPYAGSLWPINSCFNDIGKCFGK